MRRGKMVRLLLRGALAAVLTLNLITPALAAETPDIVWLPEGVVPLDASRWSGWDVPTQREVRKGDLIAVKNTDSGQVGYMDLNGELVVPFTLNWGPKEEYFFFYSDGLLPIPQYDSDGNLTGTHYVDRMGKAVIELGDNAFGLAFVDGVAIVEKNDSWGEKKWGAIDIKGNTVVPFEYDTYLPFFRSNNILSYVFADGFAMFGKKNSEGSAEAFFVSADGKTVIPLSEYDDVQNFSGGLAAVCKDEKWGYIDVSGKLVIPLQYMQAYSFNSEGVTVVTDETGERFAIDKKGNRLEDKAEPSAEPTEDPDSAAYEKLTAEGYEVTGALADNGLVLVKKDEKYGYSDKNGQIVAPAEYDLLFGRKGLFVAVKDGKCGYFNAKGETVLPLEYIWDPDHFGIMMNGYIGVVYKDGRYGIFENPYYEEPKPAGLFSSADPASSGGSASPVPGGFPVLPVAAGTAAAVAAGAFLLLRKKRR